MWNDRETALGFRDAAPNKKLLEYAAWWKTGTQVTGRVPRLLDIGCGAGRNAVPLAAAGFDVWGIDNAEHMILAAREKASAARLECSFDMATMDKLPFEDGNFDFVVAHGIWNLAQSDREARTAVAEAARVSRPGAGLFVFTFTRIRDYPRPIQGQRYASRYQSIGVKCCFSENEIEELLGEYGFERFTEYPLVVYNRNPLPGSPPPIIEGFWQKRE